MNGITVFDTFDAHAGDLFAMVGMISYVIAGLVPSFLLGGNPIDELVEEVREIEATELHRTS